MGFSDLGKKLSKLGQDTKNGVQKVSDSVSISNRISQEKKSLERLFALIGEAVYKENPDSPKAGLEDEWAAVKVAYANIASYTEQLNNIKGLVYCPNCGRPAADGDKFCAKCGFKLNIRPESTGAKMAKDLKEAGQEVGRIAGDAAGKTGEAVGGAAAGTQNAFSWLKGKFSRPKKAEDAEAKEESAGKNLDADQMKADEESAGNLGADQMKAAEEESAGSLGMDQMKADEESAGSLDMEQMKTDEPENSGKPGAAREVLEEEDRSNHIDVYETPDGESAKEGPLNNPDVAENREADRTAEDTSNDIDSSDAASEGKEDSARQGDIFRDGQA